MCYNVFIEKGELFINTSNITNYKPKDFAKLLGVSVKTLKRWDRDEILKANRTPTDRRYYIHVFSCRLYGLRKYKNQIKEDDEIAKELQNGNKSNTRTSEKDK